MIYFYLTHHPSLCSWETAGQAVKYPWSLTGKVDFVICAPAVLNSEKQAELAFAARALWLELWELPKDGSLVIWLALFKAVIFEYEKEHWTQKTKHLQFDVHQYFDVHQWGSKKQNVPLHKTRE